MSTDTALLHRAIRNAEPPTGQRVPRWGVVMRLLCVGSTTANRLCREAGVDPDEEVGSVIYPNTRCPACGEDVTYD
jgi:hypothetical protein